MFIMPSFKKSLIVEQFQGNYLNGFKRSWFVIYDGWILIRFVCFCVSRIIACDRIIMIDDSEKRNCEGKY